MPSLAQQIYLLASTPGAVLGRGFPATLYTVGGGKLEKFETIVPVGDTARLVIRTSDAIALVSTSPVKGADGSTDATNQDTTSASFLSFSQRPALHEAVAGSAGGQLADAIVVASVGEGGSRLLLPFLYNIDKSPEMQHKLLSLPTTKAGEASSLSMEDAYAHPFWTADAAGAIGEQAPLASVAGERLVLNVLGRSLSLGIAAPPASLLASLPAGPANLGRLLLLSNDQFLLAVPTRDPVAIHTLAPDAPDLLLLYDRAQRTWSRLAIEGNASTKRLFGSWLGWSVGQLNKNIPSPGKSAERNFDDGELPKITDLYTSPGDPNYVYHPGLLRLLNLKNGHTLLIRTGHEDSEIIAVGENEIIYRIDDAVFQQAMQADALSGAPTLLVRDTDVPEVHWAYRGR